MTPRLYSVRHSHVIYIAVRCHPSVFTGYYNLFHLQLRQDQREFLSIQRYSLYVSIKRLYAFQLRVIWRCSVARQVLSSHCSTAPGLHFKYVKSEGEQNRTRSTRSLLKVVVLRMHRVPDLVRLPQCLSTSLK